MLEPFSKSAPVGAGARRFYSVPEVADMFGVSPVTLYRAIRAGEFTAVRIRGRWIVSAKVIEALFNAEPQTVDASDGLRIGEGA